MERHLGAWALMREPVREVRERLGHGGKLRVLTNEPGVLLALPTPSIVYQVAPEPDPFPADDWCHDRPWVAPTLRRLDRENRCGIRVDPGAACGECDGKGTRDLGDGVGVCLTCTGTRVRLL